MSNTLRIHCAMIGLMMIAIGAMLGGCTQRAQVARPGFHAEHGRSASESLPGAMPSPNEEVWVIVRDKTAAAPSNRTGAPLPPPGTLLTFLPETQQHVPLPLKHTDVRANILGYIATVDVEQQYHNPYDGKIEAVYVFPLPQNAAVNDFVMTIGERRIRGIIRDREEATRIYQQARSQGHVASLMTQERPNVFTQSVANIEPGKQIDVSIRYFHTLAYDDGWFEFTFPMVVGPRFNPYGQTDGIGAAPRDQPRISGQTVEVPYLAPHETTGHRVSFQLDLNAGVSIEELLTPSHKADVRRTGENQASITLAAVPADRDFILRWRVAGNQIKAAFLAAADPKQAEQGYFTLMLVPPASLEQIRRQPVEMVFVVDASGSMSGAPMNQVKAAMDHALAQMTPNDTFQIISFADRASYFSATPVAATAENVRQGRAFVRGIQARGGTHMLEGVRAALNFEHDPERLRIVCFLSDGLIGNEREIFASVHRSLGNARIFSFGVGSAPNRYLMDRMAKLGRGAVAYLSLEDDGKLVMDHFFKRISHPAMANLRIDWDGLPVRDVHPQPLPDLFVGRAVMLTGRLDAITNRTHTVRVFGDAGGSEIEVGMRVMPASAIHTDHATALPAVWARQKIASLYDVASYEPSNELPRQIREIALTHNLISAYTAFVAVDGSQQTAGSQGTTVPVAVPVPHGVRYETTVPTAAPAPVTHD